MEMKKSGYVLVFLEVELIGFGEEVVMWSKVQGSVRFLFQGVGIIY